MARLDRNEPVRRNLYVAATVVALSTFFGGLAVVPDMTLQVAFAATGTSLAQFGLIAFGVERARDHSWGPRSVDEIIDAERVIGAAERGEL